MKNAAIIGCGAIASVHADGIDKCSLSRLYAVCDIKPERAEKFSHARGCKYYINFNDVLSDKEIDVVHICTPHYLHAQMAISSMEAGKDVILEKPVAINMHEALELIDAEKKTGRKLSVCFQNRYNNTSVKIKEFLESGRGGKILGAKGILNWHRGSGYYTESDWRGKWATEGGGVLINQAIHTIDLLIYFLGNVKSVNGTISTKILEDVIEVENCAEGIIEFEDGYSSLVYATSCYFRDDPVEIEIVCEKALISLKDQLIIKLDDDSSESYYDSKIELSGKNYWGSGHRKLIDEFYRSLEYNKPVLTDIKEALKALEVVLKFYNN